MDSNNSIVKKGWIYKRSRFLHKWRKRYCIIQNKQLMTFKGDDVNDVPTE